MEKSKIITNTFPVAGMSCASCAVRVDKALNGLPGVESAHVNYASATARVDYRSGECSPGTLKRAVQAAGYDLLTDAEGPAEDEAAHVRAAHYRALKRRTLWAAGLCLPIVAGGMLFMDAPAVKYAVWALSTPVVFGLGRELLRQRLETAPPRGGQHGYAGCRQYRNRLSVQPFQPVFPGILAVEGHRAARLFRVGGRHRRLHPAGAAA